METAFRTISESLLVKIQNGSIPLNQGIGIKTGDQEKLGALTSKAKNNEKKCCL